MEVTTATLRVAQTRANHLVYVLALPNEAEGLARSMEISMDVLMLENGTDGKTSGCATVARLKVMRLGATSLEHEWEL